MNTNIEPKGNRVFPKLLAVLVVISFIVSVTVYAYRGWPVEGRDTRIIHNPESLKLELDKWSMWYVQGTVDCMGENQKILELADSMGHIWYVDLYRFFIKETADKICDDYEWIRLSHKPLAGSKPIEGLGIFEELRRSKGKELVVDNNTLITLSQVRETYPWSDDIPHPAVLEQDINSSTCIPPATVKFNIVGGGNTGKYTIWVDMSESSDELLKTACSTLLWVRLSTHQITSKDRVSDGVWWSYRKDCGDCYIKLISLLGAN